MSIEDIREAYYTKPFKPFVIRLTDGRGLLVKQACNLAIAPSGQSLAYTKPDDGFVLFELTEVEKLERPKKKRTKH
mgnify:CR=1 FL=1